MKKILLKIAIVLMLVIAICIGCVQANEANGYTFGISAYRTDSSGKYAYTFVPNGSSSQAADKSKYIWNVQQHINGIANDDEVFYCLSQGYGDFGDFSAGAEQGDIPNVTGGTSQSIYSGPYRLKDTGVQDTLNSLYSETGVTAFSGTTYNGLLWIFDNMYIPVQEDRIEFLNKIQCKEDATLQGMSAYTVAEAMQLTESTQDDITDIEIEVAQQLAIWRLTNGDVVGEVFPTIYLSVNDSTLDTYRATYPEDSEYGTKYGILRQFYVKMVYDYLVEGAESAMANGYTGDSVTTVSVYANVAAQPVVTITREKDITGNYDVIIKKVDDKGNVLPGASFHVGGTNFSSAGSDFITGEDGTVKIAEGVAISEQNVAIADIYTIVESSAPEGYIKYDGTIEVTVIKKESDNGLNYIIDTVALDITSQGSGYVTVDNETNTITITIKDEPIKGEYTVKLKKQDEQGTVLQGAVFTVNETEYTTDAEGYATVATNVVINKDNVAIVDTYIINEITAPEGYLLYSETITLNVTKKLDGETYVLDTETLDETSETSDRVDITVQGNVITIIVVDKKIEGNYTVKINKQNEEGEVLQGAVFTANGTEYTTDASGYVAIADNVEINKDNVGTTDTYTIIELTAPSGYVKYNETITLNVTKKVDGANYVLDAVTLDEISEASSDVNITVEGNVITITVIDKKIEGSYTVKINKQNEEGEVLQGAVFTVNGTEYTTDVDGFATVATNVEINSENVGTVDTYTMNEIKAPDGYLFYNGTITLNVTKKVNGEIYTIDTATLDEISESSEMVDVKIEGNTITVIIIEEKIQGAYSVRINKQNQKGEVLQGAVFTVNGTNYTTDVDGYATIATNIEINSENVDVKDTYKMTEITAPTGYVVYDGEITLEVTKKIDGENYVLDQVKIDETSQASGKVSVRLEGNTITVIIIEDNIDLALRKFVSKVVDKDGTEVYSSAELVGRVPSVNTDNLKNTTDNTTTGVYNHTKQSVRVNVGDKVTYTLRIYNEGESDAYITEITDYLPKYLEYVENNQWFREYGQEDRFASKAITSTLTKITGASENLQDKIGKVLGDKILLPAYDKVNDKISYVDIQITCEVLQPEVGDDIISEYEITNIAEITEMLDGNQNVVAQDIDSTAGNVNLPETEGDWIDYKDEEIGKNDYIPGQQDDDDFEKVVIVIPKYDLSLRKFITAVQGTELTDREPVVDTATLKQGITEKGYGTAIYNHPKTPVTVKRNNVVTYTIRVYNEGNVDAYVSHITDYLPAYLEFLQDDELNIKYGWSYDENSRIIKTTITSKTTEDTTGIYTSRTNGKLLLAYAGGDTLDYIDVKVNCKVLDTAPADVNQTNIAEISGITDTKGDNVDEMDSTPNGNLTIPKDEQLPEYQKDKENNTYVPGQEDDDDFDKVVVEGDFDLALRKFITKVNEVNVDTRYPQVSIDQNGKITYTHSKEPIEVCYQDTIIYTIRVYNEGEIAGYANEITDDMPEGLEFIVDNELNNTYRWVMLDENKEVTEDVSKAKYLVTDYLSETQQAETGRNNLIQPFNKTAEISGTNPDYRDVQIAFKVTYQITSPDEERRTLVNVAQISEDSNDDVDSEPSRDEEYDEDPEDDIDYDNVKVKYFDLSLLKWVTQAIVVENGETTVIETGHTGLENPEPVVKVEIKSKNVNDVIVKFAYTIKITNEGEIAGYANEITDYIPEGLKFLAEDNPGWYEREEGIVATDLLKDILLQPGESAQVELVLTWINGEDNLGTKTNVAEISQDDNPSDTPDVDSTPDNEVPEEDDIDDAPVMLVIKTGLGVNAQYAILAITVMTILVTGTVAIKKFVLM